MLRTLVGLFRWRRRIRFNDILEEIVEELLEIRDKGDSELLSKARELSRRFSERMGFDVRVEADTMGATIWINDLEFCYGFVDHVDDLHQDTKGRGRNTTIDDLSYIR